MPAQAALEARYRDELAALGVRFHHLRTITNVPLARFAEQLTRRGEHEAYMALLVHHFNAATVEALMCRSLLSVSWDGRLHDCDFHQMADLPLGAGPHHLDELADAAALDGAPITTAPHCFACTAGAGSSCGGALA